MTPQFGRFGNQHPKMKARQIIISDMIEATREEVITNDIEYNFLQRLQGKVFSHQIQLNDHDNVETISKNILLVQDRYNISLERLNYLKELREMSKADKVAQSVEYTTPETVSVEFTNNGKD